MASASLFARRRGDGRVAGWFQDSVTVEERANPAPRRQIAIPFVHLALPAHALGHFWVTGPDPWPSGRRLGREGCWCGCFCSINPAGVAPPNPAGSGQNHQQQGSRPTGSAFVAGAAGWRASRPSAASAGPGARRRAPASPPSGSRRRRRGRASRRSASRRRLEASWGGFKPTGRGLEAAGRRVEAAGRGLEAAGRGVEAAASPGSGRASRRSGLGWR